MLTVPYCGPFLDAVRIVAIKLLSNDLKWVVISGPNSLNRRAIACKETLANMLYKHVHAV